MKSPPISAMQRLKNGVRRILRHTGYDIVRQSLRDSRYARPSHDNALPLPPGALEDLRGNHPHLQSLRARYAAVDLPMAQHTHWGGDYLQKELDLTRFRGDNAYVWQFRNVGAAAHMKYYFFMRDLAERDIHGLLQKLEEDGLFGCWTFDYPGWPLVSRDLLDSINELYFLDRHVQILQRPGFNVLDIGAGYGRLAYRTLAAAPQLGRYLCADAVPESTFLCEYYLRLRGYADRAEIVPLDELDARLVDRRIDLALNVHSFSEMSIRAIEGWLARVAGLEVPHLFIVPNDADRLLSMEEDGERRDFAPLLAAYGFELEVCEPVFPDATMREFMGVTDHFFLFRRR
jgi:hypothetical protein